jgi:hypothetical protein
MRNVFQSFLEKLAPDVFSFWTGKGVLPQAASVEAHCDVVYALYLLGLDETIAPSAVQDFAVLLASRELPGFAARSDAKPLSVHNCAYAFGALNFLSDRFPGLYDLVLSGRTLDLARIVDPVTHAPVFPPKWSHHTWRVSHWIGGVPSILLSLSRSGSACAAQCEALLVPVRQAVNAWLDPETGRLKAYQSEIVQQVFRRFYALRHDPDLGDLGGVAHILWFDHATGRSYAGARGLLAQASRLFAQHRPFMERVPYCLDFDIVQIVRTAGVQVGQNDAADLRRAKALMLDIEAFFAKGDTAGYSLHKFTGALAAYHECALTLDRKTVFASTLLPVDIIKKAYWI